MTKQGQAEFIARVAPAAQASHRKYGVPASVTIAQAILESGWGQSKLALKCQNFFGIKARLRNGQPIDAYQDFRTNECFDGQKFTGVIAPFRKFQSAEECFDRHGELLATAACYRPAMTVADDPLAFALQLKLCGYATDPNYPQELAGLIRQFNLTQYDTPSKEAPCASN